MKKSLLKIGAIAISAVMLFSFTACGQKTADNGSANTSTVEATPTTEATPEATPEPTPETALSKIKAAGKLVVGTSADYPPYEFHIMDGGTDKIVGFDMDIAKEIAKDMGVELEIKDMDFKALLGALQAGKIDMVMAGMTPNDERKQSVDFSNIYYLATQSIIVRTDDVAKYKTIADFKGVKVTTQQGSIQEGMAKEQLADSKLKTLARIGDVVLDLKSKKADAIIVEKPVAENYIKENPDLAICEVVLKEDEGGSAVAVSKGSQDMVDAINVTLTRLAADKTIDAFVAAANKLADENTK